MYTFTKTLEVCRPVDELFRMATNIQALCTMVPGFLQIKVVCGPEELKLGDTIKLRIGIFGISFFWESVIEEYRKNVYFVDRMTAGPFLSWQHKHYFARQDSGVVTVTDEINYQLPLGIIGSIANALFVERLLRVIFARRHAHMSASKEL